MSKSLRLPIGRGCIAAAIVLFGMSAGAASAETPSADELLATFENTVKKLSPVFIEAGMKQPETTPPFSEDKVGATVEVKLIHDEPRWRITDLYDTTRTIGGQAFRNGGRAEFLLRDEGPALEWNAPGDVQATEPKNLHVVAVVDNPRTGRRVWRSHLQGGEVLFGRVSGDDQQALWEIMRDASTLEVLPEQEEVAGVKTWVVKSRGKYGAHALWLDPQAGCLPRRIEVRKQPGDLINGTQLGVVETNPQPIVRNGRATGQKRPAAQEAVLRIGAVQIEVHHGVPVIMAFESTQNSLYQDGSKYELKQEFRVRTVEFDRAKWPANPLGPTITIPDGTPVDARVGPDETRDISSYEWRGGKVVRK